MSSRLVHTVATPVLFSPLWRRVVLGKNPAIKRKTSQTSMESKPVSWCRRVILEICTWFVFCCALFWFDTGAHFTNVFFHRNSNSMEISFWFHSNSNQVIATKFCAWRDRCAVVACAKICCDLVDSCCMTARWNFHQIWNVSKKLLVKWALGWFC